MKKVVIGFKNGQPYVIAKPKKVEVIFQEEKKRKRSFRKVWRTLIYRLKVKAGIAG